ncbi:TadE/TadG family type IV pilus assembly protein [Methylopila sp. M107]|uniref:TadE/TadG family type IV pilus assembly protein n=1 Tax=Methylopila sp. M107 TaxID=1101190 RepID=UPI00035EDEC7|nr:TadE/TadG family type IV pilus assembly protein [Methylopila sp. M107]
MKRALLRRLRLSDDRGVAAIEFGLLAPLLCAMIFAGVEFARIWMVSRQFEAAVTGLTRHLARYPEYDSKVRSFAPPITAALMPFGSTSGLNCVVYSLTKTSAGMTLNFPAHVLFGSNPGIAWSNVVSADSYVLGETVIVVSASYKYTPLFGAFAGAGFTLSKSYATLPAFNRRYPWNAGVAPDKYVY